MPVTTWNAGAIAESARKDMVSRMQRATVIIADAVKRLLNRSQPTSKAGKSGRRRGLAPSKPGEPPKRLEGRLIASIATEVTQEGGDVVGRVGTNVDYARRLELGFSGTDAKGRTIRQASRPFLRRGMVENRDAAARELGVET